MNYNFIDLTKIEDPLNIEIVILDFSIENFNEKMLKYKNKNFKIIVLVGEDNIREMRELFLSGLINDCILRKDIFELEDSLQKLENNNNNFDSFYLCDSFKRGVYSFDEINYITYSSISRKTEFHLTNSEIFNVKSNFSEVETKIKNINYFYKLDRGTLINIKLIGIIDLKEELIIFKNKQYIYTSKTKLKELEENYNLKTGKIIL